MTITQGLNQLFKRRGQFLVIGLTGRTGSGCTSASMVLARDFDTLQLDAVASPLTTPEQRKYRIIHEFAQKNWEAFVSVSVTQVIVSFLLEQNKVALEQFLSPNVKKNEFSQLITEILRVSELWATVKQVVEPGRKKSSSETESFLKFWEGELTNLVSVLRRTLAANYSSVFQSFGDNLRASGSVLDSSFDPAEFFTLPKRVGEIVVALRELQLSKGKAARIVLDALRNPFEIEYFRQRFASFYLIAITTPDDHRLSRLSVRLNLTAAQIKKLDGKEYPAENKPLAGSSQFVSQNIQACIEKSDIFIRNSGLAKEDSVADLKELERQLILFVVLMHHPGLITPTKVERCMQIAYSAKANSGCISRQVGAVIADSSYSIKAVGWNDVPAGQVPCILRKSGDLVDSKDREAFSDYELGDKRFQEHIKRRYKTFDIQLANGRSSAFCFKSEYNSLESQRMKGNQVHTRSLHAEENAFLQLSKHGGAGIHGGILFTSASPCELCSKKAFQLGIKKIIYIDPYPGISLSHVLGSGVAGMRPEVELFSGAVGQAFHRLYDPLLPYKDEIEVFMAPMDAGKTGSS